MRIVIRAHLRQPDEPLAATERASFGVTEDSSVCALLRGVRDPRHCRAPVQTLVYGECPSIELQRIHDAELDQTLPDGSNPRVVVALLPGCTASRQVGKTFVANRSDNGATGLQNV